MASPKVLQVPVTAGMRQDVSEHLAPPGTLTYAKNVRFLIDGEVQARSGVSALSCATSATITYASLCAAGPDYIAPVPGGFVVGCKGFGYRYDFGQSRLHVAGSYGNALPGVRLVSMAREELVVTPATPTPFPVSQAVANGYICVLYSINNGGGVSPENNGWFVQVFTEGGTPVASFDQFAIGNATAGYVVADGSAAATFVVLKRDGVTLSAAVITTTSSGATIGAFSAVASLNGAGYFWGAATWPGIGWALVYQGGAASLAISKMAGVTTVATQGIGVTGTCPVSCYANAAYVYVGWREDGGPYDVKARVYDTSLTLTSGGSVTLIAEAVNNDWGPPLFGAHVAGVGTAFVAVGFSNAPSTNDSKMRCLTLTAAGVVVTAGTDGDVYGAQPVTQPFNNGMVWCRREVGSNAASVRNVLLDYQLDRIGTSYLKNPKIALVTDEAINGVSSTFYGGWYVQHLGFPVQLSSGDWLAGLPRTVRLDNVSGNSSGLAVAEWLTFATEEPRQAVSFFNDALVPGDLVTTRALWGTNQDSGLAAQVNGSDVGFYSAPNIKLIASSNSTGSLRSSTTYQYRAVIERIDDTGNRFRSPPSIIKSVTTGGSDNTVTLTVVYPTDQLRSSGRSSSSFDPPTTSRNVVHFYRTASAGIGVTGQQFQRCTPPQGAPFTTDGVVAFIDTLSDSELSTREFLYTDGGVLDNNHPTSCQFVRSTEDRVWLGGLWDSNQIQSSKILVPGEPPQFSDSPAFRVVLPNDCTGLAIQDGIVVAFCEQGIYAIQGQGPNDQGQGAWDSPRCITRSTGCVNSQSIVETSVGIFFQSDRGIELLPRGCGEPQFIGEPVMDLMDQLGSTDVVSACVVSTVQSKTVRFCIGGPYVMVFDLDTRAWSFDQYPVNVSAICDTDQGAVLALEDASGGTGFYLENAASSLDNATEISSDLAWAAVRPFGIAGYGKFIDAIGMFDEALGYRTGNCTLYLTVDRAADAGSPFAMATFNQPDYRKHEPQYNTGSAAKLRLTTAVGGWRFMGWTVELEEISGGRRMTETEQS